MLMNELVSKDQRKMIDDISEWCRVERLDAIYIRYGIKEQKLMQRKHLFVDGMSRINAVRKLIAYAKDSIIERLLTTKKV